MTFLTLFTLGRSTSIPFSTVTIAHHFIKAGYVAEVLILDHWFDRKVANNDTEFTIK